MAIYHEFTREIVCPHCGHKESDSWDFGSGVNDSGEHTCGECDQDFEWDRNVTIDYCTEIIKLIKT